MLSEDFRFYSCEAEATLEESDCRFERIKSSASWLLQPGGPQCWSTHASMWEVGVHALGNVCDADIWIGEGNKDEARLVLSTEGHPHCAECLVQP